MYILVALEPHTTMEGDEHTSAFDTTPSKVEARHMNSLKAAATQGSSTWLFVVLQGFELQE
jgi:hypothetical protein